MNFFQKRHQIYEGSSRLGKDSIRLVSLGGVSNVTKNMFVYEYRYDEKLRDILIIDCGVGFPDPDMYGVDLIIPDVRYLSDKKDKIRGLIFTHGHDDHIGAIPYIYPQLGRVPMWASKLTAAFANVKLSEAKIKARVTPCDFTKVIRAGPFTVSFIRVTHSIPDAAHLIIETPVGIFYHGSDFKFDFNPLDGKISELAKINAAGRRNILCLLTDSLGSERRGFTASEQIIGTTIEKELSLCAGKFFFTTQSSNISRIQLAIEIAIAHRRQIAFFGRSIEQNIEAALKLGYMKFPREVVVRDRDLKRLPRTKQFLIVAGSQGQPESALSRIANDEHRWVRLNENDTVMISADPIPGNEHNFENLIEQLYRQGARISYPEIMEDIHVSGHGSQADLMLLLSALSPRHILPIGGTYRHLMQYRRLALELGYDKKEVLLPQEGQMLEFSLGKARVVQTLNLENVMVDGLVVGDVGKIVLRDRQTIATEGIIIVIVPFEKATGRLAGKPDLVSRGFIYMKESGKLVNQAKEIVGSAINPKHGRVSDWQFVKKQIEEKLAKFFTAQTGRYPLIVPVIVEV